MALATSSRAACPRETSTIFIPHRASSRQKARPIPDDAPCDDGPWPIPLAQRWPVSCRKPSFATEIICRHVISLVPSFSAVGHVVTAFAKSTRQPSPPMFPLLVLALACILRPSTANVQILTQDNFDSIMFAPNTMGLVTFFAPVRNIPLFLLKSNCSTSADSHSLCDPLQW